MAAATRGALKRKRTNEEVNGVQVAEKKVSIPPAELMHDVVQPVDYVPREPLDPDIHGLSSSLSGKSDCRALWLLTRGGAGSMQQPVYKGTMAKQYPFKLDNFQEVAIACLVSRNRPSPVISLPAT